ncbi:collagen binding domain-containing protein [uncultured Eubacterium sp.]|uniref:MSCRAMM family protein n=1 Tax=uncultured Eubacterium sp. TaxID=165185 RepID=UPI0025E67182|nr:prealbumin-like fold domain-containing protein [uncultured Eubacterium sp.]
MRKRIKRIFCALASGMLLCGSTLPIGAGSVMTYAAEVNEWQMENQNETETKEQSENLKLPESQNQNPEETRKQAQNDGLEQIESQDQLELAWNIATFAAKNTTLTKSTKQMFAGYYPSGAYDCKESILYLNNSWCWCMEPSQVIGNVGSGVNYALANNGDALQWIKNRFGWSWAKSNNLSKAVYFARSYFPGDANCTYALIQNLVWSEITSSESPSEAGRYLLTNGAEKSAHVCTHLDTKEKVQAAIRGVWAKVSEYHKMPSYDGQIIHISAGQSCWVPDTGSATKDLTFNSPSGVQVTKGNNDGIWIRTDASAAGKSFTINFTKNTVPSGNEGVLVYEATDKRRQAVALWNSAITPDYGSVRVIVDRNEYLNAKYKAREAVSPAFDLHIEKTDSDTGEPLANAVFDVYMDGVKAASVTTDNDGKAAYHWRGDVLYTSYYEDTQPVLVSSEWNQAYNTARNNVKEKVDQALADLKEQTRHTWKVVERQAPEGYELNETVWEETFDLNTEAVEVDYTDRPKKGFLNMKKISANPGITDKNACYSLNGAVYGIYGSVEDAKADHNRLETLTTDADGNSNEIGLYAGIYYVKEVTAPAGYELCNEKEDSQAEAGIHTVEIRSNETTTFTCKEKPGDNPFALLLQKLDRRTGSVTASGTASVRGAIFELSYFANTDGTIDSAVRKWYFKTNENGTFNCNEDQQVVAEYQTNDGQFFRSDAFYQDTEGRTVYPVGTYQIREVSAPLYFQKSGHMHFVTNKAGNAEVTEGLTAVIRQEANGGKTQVYDGSRVIDGKIEAANLKVEAYDEPQYGSVTIYKEETDGSRAPLSGVRFKMTGQTDGTEYEAQTDADGKIVWEQLVSQKYVITEIQTVDGRSLLKEPIEVTLPMEMTWEEIQRNGADPTQALFDEVSGKYCFYNISLTVGNSVTFDLPMTGGNPVVSYVVLSCGLAAAAAGVFILLKRSNRKYHKNEKMKK